MRIAAVDIGTASLGLATGDERARLDGIFAAELPRLDGEGAVVSLQRRLQLQLLEVQRRLVGCDVAVAEELVLSRKDPGATAAAALCWGMLLTLCADRSVPLYAVGAKRWQGVVRKRARGMSREDYEHVLYEALARHLSHHCTQGGSQEVAALLASPKSRQLHGLDAGGILTVGAMRPHLLRLVSLDVEGPASWRTKPRARATRKQR